jgi:hypothetical protein
MSNYFIVLQEKIYLMKSARVMIKKTKTSLLITLSILSGLSVFGQVDSIHSVFNKPIHIRLPLRYCYLQWDVGYKGFLFQQQYLNGYSADLIGAVFNYNVAAAVGFATGFSSPGFPASQSTIEVRSYNMIYIKAEPMLFPEHIFNISAPLMLSESSFSYTYGAIIYHSRHNRNPTAIFTAFTGGLNFIVNLFKNLSAGAGADYRFGLGASNSSFLRDYDNYSVSIFLRIRVNTRKTRPGLPTNRDDYYPFKN